MATIKIKDLTESVDLDRQAMTAITGGARLRGRQPMTAPGLQPGQRIVAYPAGFKSGAPSTGKKPAK